MLFTDRLLKTLTVEPGRKDRLVFDDTCPKLGLRISASGSKSFLAQWTDRATGRKVREPIGKWGAMTIAQARVAAEAIIGDVARGVDRAAERRRRKAEDQAARAAAAVKPADLVEDVVALFVERYAKGKQRSWEETARILDREVVKPWRGKRLSAIGRADVHALLDGIVDRGSPIMANRVLAALRKMSNWAVERGLIPTSPCDKIKAPSAERSRDRILDDGELRKLWTACDGLGWPFRDLVRLLLLTGQRREEVGQMRWSELDLDAGLWSLPRTRVKNNTAHTVALSAPVLAILHALPRIDGSDLVFSTNSRTAVSGFGKAKARLDEAMGEGVPPWVLHDLRRTFVSGLARLGVALPTIERAVNHVSGSFKGIVGVYNRHDFGPERKQAFDAWGGFIERLVAGQDGNVVPLARVE